MISELPNFFCKIQVLEHWRLSVWSKDSPLRFSAQKFMMQSKNSKLFVISDALSEQIRAMIDRKPHRRELFSRSRGPRSKTKFGAIKSTFVLRNRTLEEVTFQQTLNSIITYFCGLFSYYQLLHKMINEGVWLKLPQECLLTKPEQNSQDFYWTAMQPNFHRASLLIWSIIWYEVPRLTRSFSDQRSELLPNPIRQPKLSTNWMAYLVKMPEKTFFVTSRDKSVIT